MNTFSENKEFHPIRVLTSRTFRNNRGRNLAAILAILLTTLMFTTLFTLAQSLNRNMIEMTFRQTGSDAPVTIRGLTEEQAARIAAHPDVRETGESIVLGLAENTALTGTQVEIRWADAVYAAHSYSAPTTGRLPQTADEAALDTLTLDRLGIPHELGQTVTLEWRKDLSCDEVTVSSFTLCGFWEGNESSYSHSAWVSREYADAMTAGAAETDAAGVETVGTDAAGVETVGADADRADADNAMLGLRMLQIFPDTDQDIEGVMDGILAETGLTGLKYSVNLAYLPEMNASVFQESLPMYLGMLLVFAAGYLIIYNIFQISVTADIRFYGRLKTLGASTRQIKRLLYGQADRLCLIGVPAGLLSGWLLGMVLVPVLMGTAAQASVSASPVIFLGSALFSWLTVLISCLRPARLAAKVSPVEALRMSDADVPQKDRRMKKAAGNTTVKGHRMESSHPGRTGSAFLLSMAFANLGRNRRRTLTVICSLTLGLVLLCCFYAQNAAFDMEKYLADLTLADFELSEATSEDYIGGYDPQGTTLSDSLVSQAEALAGLEETGRLYSAQIEWELPEDTVQNLAAFYTEDRLADWESYDPSGAQMLRDALDTRAASAVLYGLDGIPLQAAVQEPYLMAGAFDAQAFSTGAYVLAVGPSIERGTVPDVIPAPTPGTEVSFNGQSYTVMAVVYPLNPVTEGASQKDADARFQLCFILPADEFQSLWPEHTLRKLFLNVDDGHLKEAEAFFEEYTETVNPGLPVVSRQSMADQYQAQTRSAAVTGSAVSIVIALVGVLNFVNSMVTAILSRRREFAVIQSVGMTKKQLCRMLVMEGLCYALITLASSLLLGSLAVGVGVRAMVAGGFTTFRFTLLPLLLCTPILLFAAALIPFLCFRNLEKHSIVERLRME